MHSCNVTVILFLMTFCKLDGENGLSSKYIKLYQDTPSRGLNNDMFIIEIIFHIFFVYSEIFP